MLLEDVHQVVPLAGTGQVLALLGDRDEADAHLVNPGFAPAHLAGGGLLWLRGLLAELSKWASILITVMMCSYLKFICQRSAFRLPDI